MEGHSSGSSSDVGGTRTASMSPEHDEASRFSTPDPDAVREYFDLMAALLPQSTASTGAATPSTSAVPAKRAMAGNDDDENDGIVENGVKRPMTKAEKQNAKKKRRKERERDAKMDEVVAKREEQEKEEMAKPVAFRLFSERPMVNVSLMPDAEEYEIPINPRHVALQANVAAKIRDLAEEAAFDPSHLGDRVSAAPTPSRRRAKPIRTLYAARGTDIRPSTALFIVQAHQADRAGADKAGAKTSKPKSGTMIPRIDLFDAAALKQKRQRTKRTRRQE